MNKYKVVKLDKRHTGNQYFQYYIQPTDKSFNQRLLDYHQYRQWCWTAFGPSMEREFMVSDEFKWCWYTHHSLLRIYFKSDKELNWFKLTWPT